jgi:hypothetical protein
MLTSAPVTGQRALPERQQLRVRGLPKRERCDTVEAHEVRSSAKN